MLKSIYRMVENTNEIYTKWNKYLMEFSSESHANHVVSISIQTYTLNKTHLPLISHETGTRLVLL